MSQYYVFSSRTDLSHRHKRILFRDHCLTPSELYINETKLSILGRNRNSCRPTVNESLGNLPPRVVFIVSVSRLRKSYSQCFSTENRSYNAIYIIMYQITIVSPG